MSTEPTAQDLLADKDKYWETWGGIAPIKKEFVLWHKMSNPRTTTATPSSTTQDDLAEGRTTRQEPHSEPSTKTEDQSNTVGPLTTREEEKPLRSGDIASVPPPVPETNESTTEDTDTTAAAATAATAGEEPESKKVRLSGAQKKALAKARQQEEWEAKKLAKQNGDKVKQKGQNKNRKFDHHAGTGDVRLCNLIAQGKPCERSHCNLDHDLKRFLESRLPDIETTVPTDPDQIDPATIERQAHVCPLWKSLGKCPYGFKCRYGQSHIRKVEGDNAGFLGCGYELVELAETVKAREVEMAREGKDKLSHMAEKNFVSTLTIKSDKFPISHAYFKSIGEPFDGREENGKGGRRGNKRDRNGEQKPQPQEEDTKDVEGETTGDVDDHPSRSFVPDLARVRASEKRRLDFKGKLYMAPLTTVGNLPFRRLCVENGLDITCSEMGLAQEFLTGNANEWSLLRRHPSEKLFGVQITGSKPQVLVPAAEAIVKHADIDFLDVNCGCPIDLVFNKGAGSALLAHAGKLGKSLIGMGQALGEIPLTIKIRTGVTNSQPVAHKLMSRVQSEWGIQAITMHGRSRQQRYKNLADYKYIGECAKVLREHAADEGLEPIPIFGNGDAYDYRTYYENMESSGVDGIMIARGALIKPWIFSEIKERRDWDISSRERLDMIGKLCDYGLEHWGSDQIGVNKVRRFVCESLSFTHRYVPVGLLERLPAHMNERALPFKGRDELETLLASDQANDWVKITNMFLGQPPDDWSFIPKHKAASADPEAQG
ncbi:tRNA dihydrouridine synthase DUS3 [Sporobolomyces koalae]|uniref:tRNA dihydrouridine synthase DUS3 n=1 Tax=Sporobolomyces koalae TaxID=500713 RepID=UPI003172BEC5